MNNSDKFPFVCAIGKMGVGTLISPDWVLTAAHVATAADKRRPKIRFGEKEFDIDKVFIYPGWTDMQPNDIALIRLTKPVNDIKPAFIYLDSNEAGLEIKFIGNGGTGTGLKGPAKEDGQWRVATNVVDRVDQFWLFFDFDGPSDSGAISTELEGISGPGDSGGPALFERDGKIFVTGVSVFGNPGKKGRGTYGATEGYTRVSRYSVWISKTINK